MAPLPANNTSRVFVDYTDGTNQHTVSCRFDESFSSAEEAVAQMAGFLNAHGQRSFLITIIGARSQGAGESVSLPITWTGDATYGSGLMSPTLAPRQVLYLGRSADGRRIKVSMFGSNLSETDNFRTLASSVGDVGEAIAVLEAAGLTGAFLTISNLVPLWLGYVSHNYNNHFETLAHRS